MRQGPVKKYFKNFNDILFNNMIYLNLFSKLIKDLADCLVFGSLEKCPQCKIGHLDYRYFIS